MSADAADPGARIRALGFEVYDPDMPMLTLGGGGVHCLSQADIRGFAHQYLLGASCFAGFYLKAGGHFSQNLPQALRREAA